MQIAQNLTPEQALNGFVVLARNTKLSYEEHMQYGLFAQVIKNEIDEHIKTKAELQAAQEEVKRLTPVDRNPVSEGPSQPEA